MEGYPITHGYTINIVKDKTKPTFILLNPPNKLTVIKNQVKNIAEPNTKELSINETAAGGDPKSDVVYYEEVVTASLGDTPDHITEVAHEEVVEDAGNLGGAGDAVSLQASVHCDLCNTVLPGPEAARLHMVNIHNMLTFEGPCFKCDFCNILVTDRVSHMKTAHYSPLAQVLILFPVSQIHFRFSPGLHKE